MCQQLKLALKPNDTPPQHAVLQYYCTVHIYQPHFLFLPRPSPHPRLATASHSCHSCPMPFLLSYVMSCHLYRLVALALAYRIINRGGRMLTDSHKNLNKSANRWVLFRFKSPLVDIDDVVKVPVCLHIKIQDIPFSPSFLPSFPLTSLLPLAPLRCPFPLFFSFSLSFSLVLSVAIIARTAATAQHPQTQAQTNKKRKKRVRQITRGPIKKKKLTQSPATDYYHVISFQPFCAQFPSKMEKDKENANVILIWAKATRSIPFANECMNKSTPTGPGACRRVFILPCKLDSLNSTFSDSFHVPPTRVGAMTPNCHSDNPSHLFFHNCTAFVNDPVQRDQPLFPF